MSREFGEQGRSAESSGSRSEVEYMTPSGQKELYRAALPNEGSRLSGIDNVYTNLQNLAAQKGLEIPIDANGRKMRLEDLKSDAEWKKLVQRAEAETGVYEVGSVYREGEKVHPDLAGVDVTTTMVDAPMYASVNGREATYFVAWKDYKPSMHPDQAKQVAAGMKFGENVVGNVPDFDPNARRQLVVAAIDKPDVLPEWWGKFELSTGAAIDRSGNLSSRTERIPMMFEDEEQAMIFLRAESNKASASVHAERASVADKDTARQMLEKLKSI